MIRSLARDARVFVRELRRTCPDPALRRLAAVRHFRRWRATLAEDMYQVRDRPWMTFGAIRFLERYLRPGMRVFEYGMGSSTVFLTRRVAEVFSVEHDAEWFQRLREALTAGAPGWSPLLRTPEPHPECSVTQDPSEPADYASSDGDFAGMSFRAYATAIDAYPEDSFDLVSVDGRARPSCLAHGAARVRPGGFLLLDNAEREHYAAVPARLEAEGWAPRRFCGPGPHNRYFWTTAVWRRPA